MNKRKQNRRYPGPKPFEADERMLFFGREKEIEQLYNFVRLRKISVLYGKSGLGKTSLLNAGVIPLINGDESGQTFFIRFTNRPKENSEQIFDKFIQSIFQDPIENTFLDKISSTDASFWFYFKKLQYKNKAQQQYTIVLDQFEELFTYPEDEVNHFAEELGLLLSNNISDNFRLALRQAMKDESVKISDEELNLIYEPINVRVILAIRSDRLSFLDRLTPYIPSVLQNCYELKPFTEEQARNAIQKPAAIVGNFVSPEFVLTPRSMEIILNSLSGHGSSSIESFQLQLICQYIENLVIKIVEKDKNKAEGFAPPVILDLSQTTFDIDNIIQDFYIGVINDIPQEHKRNVRILLEEKLIFEEEQQRISLFEGQILKQLNIEKPLLDKLVSSHIIRSERSTGGFYYELSHDSFIQPILKLKNERLYLEQQQKAIEEYDKKRKEEERLDSFKAARELRGLEKKKIRLMEKDIEKRRLLLAYSRLKQMGFKRLAITGFISLFVIALLAALIIFGIIRHTQASARGERLEHLTEEINTLNTKLDQHIIQLDSSDSQAIKRQLNELLNDYKKLTEEE